MTVVEVVHRSHGIHETVLHELCRQCGIFRDNGVDVELVDGSGPRWRAASASPAAATVAVGGVVSDWIRGDTDWNVHFVATAKPLMWVVGTRVCSTVSDLEGRRIATADRRHMPSLFLRLILERHGLDVIRDVDFVEVSDRPDRLRLLESGDVDAALLGPEGLALPIDGFRALLYVGDHIEFPTVGFAARPGLDQWSVAAITASMSAGLERLRSDEVAAIAAMQAVEPDVPADVAGTVAREVIRTDWAGPSWAASGSIGDVLAVAALLDLEVAAVDRLRDLLHGWVSR